MSYDLSLMFQSSILVRVDFFLNLEFEDLNVYIKYMNMGLLKRFIISGHHLSFAQLVQGIACGKAYKYILSIHRDEATNPRYLPHLAMR